MNRSSSPRPRRIRGALSLTALSSTVLDIVGHSKFGIAVLGMSLADVPVEPMLDILTDVRLASSVLVLAHNCFGDWLERRLTKKNRDEADSE